MSFDLHLWEYKNCYFGDVPLNHKAKAPYYNSWEEYLLEEEKIRSCNCAYNSCILYFNWEEPEDFEEDFEENKGGEKYAFLTLIIRNWFSGITSIKIRVKRRDEKEEEKIKEYLKQNLPNFLTGKKEEKNKTIKD